MHIISTPDEMTETARGWLTGGTVGFVPTMGYLHDGHRSLIQAAHAECEVSIASLFVNPLQFRSHEEFLQYPRDLEHDLQLLSEEEVDVVFIPKTEDIYPETFSTYVTPRGPLAERLEGAISPEYVCGTATVMTKLFHLIRPDVVYLGQKDAQQIAIIRQLVRDLTVDIHLRILPTVRMPDGLAWGSRNQQLTPEQRQQAPQLYQALLAGKAAIEQGERNIKRLQEIMRAHIAKKPLLRLEYVSICDPDTFVEYDEMAENTLITLAAQLGSVRLIDNILLLKGSQWHI